MYCLFCYSQCHYIIDCQEPIISLLHEKITEIYIDMVIEYPDDIKARFKSVLSRSFSLGDLRVVCCTSTNSPSVEYAKTKQDIIDILYDYYMSLYQPRISASSLYALEILPTQGERMQETMMNLEDRNKKYDIYPELVEDNEGDEGKDDCIICYESIKCIDLVKLNCRHKFCASCIVGLLTTHNNMLSRPSCALCRKKIESFSVKNKEIYNLISEYCI